MKASKLLFLSPLVALLLIGAAPQAALAELQSGSTLTFSGGNTAVQECTDGGCFGMEVGSGVFVWTMIAANEGIVVGQVQAASGSHSGGIDGTETASVDSPWAFMGNTGLHHTISPTSIISDDGIGNVTLDFSGWSVAWNGIQRINMGGDTANVSEDTGTAQLTCDSDCGDGDGYSLVYDAHVPIGDASGFGGVSYRLRLFGAVIAPENNIPVAHDGTLSTVQDVGVDGFLSGEDADSDPLTFELRSFPSLGNVVLVDETTGAIDYEPTPGVFGVDVFTFAVSDGRDWSAPAVVEVAIMEAGNTAPIAAVGSASTDEDTVLSGQLNATDGEEDPLVYKLVEPAEHGQVTVSPDGGYIYWPDANFNGEDSFSFSVKDNSAHDTAVVNLLVYPVNDSPVVGDIRSTRPQNSIQMGHLWATDADNIAEDGSGQTITFEITAEPLNGTLELAETVYDSAAQRYTAAFAYTPSKNFAGSDFFTYRVSDKTDVTDDTNYSQNGSVLLAVTGGFVEEDNLETAFGCSAAGSSGSTDLGLLATFMLAALTICRRRQLL